MFCIEVQSAGLTLLEIVQPDSSRVRDPLVLDARITVHLQRAIRQQEEELTHKMKLWKILTITSLLGAAPAFSAAIAITNPSFESVTLNANTAGCTSGGKLILGDYIDNSTNFGQANGCVDPQPLPGWTMSGGDGGATAIDIQPYFMSIPDGQNAGFVQRAGLLDQTLSDPVAAGLYTFSIYIGNRADSLFLTGYTISLLAGNTVIGSSHNTVNPAPGEFSQDTLSVNVAPGDAWIGQALTIELSSSGNGQAIFDLAALDFAPDQSGVPEPSTFVMGSLALAGGGLLRRRLVRQGGRRTL
jgi:hypothetical protein